MPTCVSARSHGKPSHCLQASRHLLHHRGRKLPTPLHLPHHRTPHPLSNGRTSGTKIRLEGDLPVMNMQNYGHTCLPEKEEPGPSSWLLSARRGRQRRLRVGSGDAEHQDLHHVRNGKWTSPRPPPSVMPPAKLHPRLCRWKFFPMSGTRPLEPRAPGPDLSGEIVTCFSARPVS